MGEADRKKIQVYSLARVLAEMSAIYMKLLEKRPSRPPSKSP